MRTLGRWDIPPHPTEPQLVRHNHIDGRKEAREVYDVTKFLDDHPGGDDVLVLATEKDATEDFEDVGHSQDAKDIMKKYYVGEIDSNSFVQKSNRAMPSSSFSVSDQPSGSSSTNVLTFLLPVLILVLAYALYYFGKKEVVISHH
ncbi:hypothetical protein OSB04_031925 [Centaurea solstitialis]|uniref:Cytochrome b5 heme-binding domain-containing protein n=1 Tax=Centaurea solstitialis TaxID=347529 RepID=A0AA38VY23_9ASTR|nr:hypothetical protein OSB04_031925 [Centaurea solstitialis]